MHSARSSIQSIAVHSLAKFKPTSNHCLTRDSYDLCFLSGGLGYSVFKDI